MCYSAKMWTEASVKMSANRCVLVGWANKMDPFNGNGFDFTKVGQQEILIHLQSTDNGELTFYPNAPIDTEKSPCLFSLPCI